MKTISLMLAVASVICAGSFRSGIPGFDAPPVARGDLPRSRRASGVAKARREARKARNLRRQGVR
jgi:hypothetical protein